MKSVLLASTIAFSCLSTNLFADPQADADYIISQTVTREMFEAAISAQRPIIISAIQNDLRAKGITLPDPDRFFDLLMSEFIDEFTRTMQSQTASLYFDNFSEQQLADIAAFYKTESGQALIAATPAIMMEGARMGHVAGQQAGANAGARLADRIEAEGLISIDDPGLMSRLLEALR